MTQDKKFFAFLITAIVVIGGFAITILWQINSVNKTVQKTVQQSEKKLEPGVQQEFKSEKYGFQFKYPTAWQAVRSSEEQFNQKMFEQNKYLSHIDFSKASKFKTYIRFDGKPCGAIDAYCNFAVIVQEYDEDNSEEFFCFEGSCEIHTDIVEEREEIESNPDTMIGGYKARMRDEYFKDGDIFNRIYTVITDTYELSIIASYDSTGFSNFLQTNSKEMLPLEQVVLENPTADHHDDFSEFLKTVTNLVSTITFSQTVNTMGD